MAEYIKVPDDLVVEQQIMRGLDTIGVRRIDLSFLPVIDAVDVVRCKDCKHWRGTDEYGDGYCGNPDGIDNVAHEKDFCSYGERKEENGC